MIMGVIPSGKTDVATKLAISRLHAAADLYLI